MVHNRSFYLQGSPNQEQNQGIRNIIQEECALAGLVNLSSELIYDCLLLQEHRGGNSIGIVSYGKSKFNSHKKLGKIREKIARNDLPTKTPGKLIIGHNRYPTIGSQNSQSNIQPLIFQNSKFGPFAIAHNGTLLNCKQINKQLVKSGTLFQSTTDSELFAHLLTHSNANTLIAAIGEVTTKIPGAYSMLILTPRQIIAFRDKFGIRPLSICKYKNGFIIASENYVFDQFPGTSEIYDLKAGEIVILTTKSKEIQPIQYITPEEHFCVFEGIYFSSPRSTYNNYFHENFRELLGKELYKENMGEINNYGEVIVPILDSGKSAALGLSEASGITYREYFLRIHNPANTNDRSFTCATQTERINAVDRKLHLKKDKIKGKKIILVDDSIVRSNTIKRLISKLRDAGAASITACISAPPIINVCPMGMDYQTKKELIAHNKSITEIEQIIQADKLIYLSIEGLQNVVSNTYKCGICTGCFDNNYPVQIN